MSDYNGWTDRATWQMAQHILADPDLHAHFTSIARNIAKGAIVHVNRSGLTSPEARRHLVIDFMATDLEREVTQALRDAYDRHHPVDSPRDQLIALHHAMAIEGAVSVDWYQVTDALVPEDWRP